MDVLTSGRQRRTPRAWSVLPLLAVAVATVGVLAAADLRAQQREDELGRVDLVLSGSDGASATPGSAGTAEAVVRLRLRNVGADPVRLLDQRLDGGPPVEATSAGVLAAGASVLLAVRWRVLCSEIGSLYGPASLGLTVRTRSGGVGRVELALGAPAAPAGPRRELRLAASGACTRGAS